MKRLFLIFILLFSLIFGVFSASAVQVSNGAIPSAALEYFEGVVIKLPEHYEYFLYRSGDYTSVLVSSEDLHLDGSVVSGTNVTCYEYNTRAQNGGYNQYTPAYTKYTYDSIQIDTDIYSIAYSSLGDWSPLISREESKSYNWIQYILWSVVLILLVFICFKLIRNRRSYISL